MSNEFHKLLSDSFRRMNRQYGNPPLQHEILRSLKAIFKLLGKSLSKLAVSGVHLELQISLAHDGLSEGRQMGLKGIVNK